MSNTRKLKQARRTAVVMAGVATTALATGGAGIANAASGPPHVNLTSGTIYACYSNTTKTLTETTQTKGCKSGFTELSWNAKGPQGAQGPQGLQGPQGGAGPQGAVGPQGANGVSTMYAARNSLSRTFTGPNSFTSETVATFSPPPGFYAMTITTDVGTAQHNQTPVCHAVVHAPDGFEFSSTVPHFLGMPLGGFYGELTMNGQMNIRPGSTVLVNCTWTDEGASSNAFLAVAHTEITGVQVNQINFGPSQAAHSRPRARPLNTFLKRGAGSGRVTRRG